MPNTKPKFNKKAYKHAISMVESAGGKYLKNGNALGRYQFIYRYIKDTPEMKGVSKRQFMNDRELQEKIMDTALDGKLKNFTYGPAYAQKFIRDNNTNISIEDATALVHFLGPGDAKKAIQNPDTFKVPGVNLTVDEYLSKFKTNYQRYQKHEDWMEKNQTEDNPIQMAYDQNGMAILREDKNPNQPYVAPATNNLPEQPQQNIQGEPIGFSPEGVAIANIPDQSVQASDMPNAGGVMRIENQNDVPSLQDGFLRLEDQMKVQGLELTGQKSDPGEDRYQQNRYFLGGQMLEQLGSLDGKIAEAEAAGGIGSQAPGSEGGGPGIGAYVGAAGTALSLGKMAFGKNDMDTSGMTAPEEIPSKGSAALSGAMQGASAGMAFGPWGAAIGGVVGGAAGLMGNAKAEKAEQKAHRNYYSRIHDKATNAYEYGGSMESPDASPVNGAAELVTMFENGGTHEQNSLGGIPQGMGANGKPNLVEEGETKFEDYIFSNNINMDGTYSDKEDAKDSQYRKGGMLKRADGSYSKRGLWDNIRANKGSGKKPTAEMLKQERKINSKAEGGELDPPTKEELLAQQSLPHLYDTGALKEEYARPKFGEGKTSIKSKKDALRELHKYELENNPERLEGEDEKTYKLRQKQFADRIEAGKSTLDKNWEKIKSKQEELPWLIKTISEVVTSPVDIAYGLSKKIDIPNTERYKTEKQLRGNNYALADAALDNLGLLAGFGLVAGSGKKTAFNLAKKATPTVGALASGLLAKEYAGEIGLGLTENAHNYVVEDKEQQYAYGGTLSDLTRMVPSKGPSIQELLRIKKRKELAAKRKKRKNK